MQPTFVNGTGPGKSWEKRIFESWKILERSILMSLWSLVKETGFGCRIQAVQSAVGGRSHPARDGCLWGAAASGQRETVAPEGGAQDVAVLRRRRGRGGLDQGEGADHVVTRSRTWLDQHPLAADQTQGLIPLCRNGDGMEIFSRGRMGWTQGSMGTVGDES